MSVELNCAQGGQTSLLCKKSIKLVEPFPGQRGWDRQVGGPGACPQDPTGPPGKEGRTLDLSTSCSDRVQMPPLQAAQPWPVSLHPRVLCPLCPVEMTLASLWTTPSPRPRATGSRKAGGLPGGDFKNTNTEGQSGGQFCQIRRMG